MDMNLLNMNKEIRLKRPIINELFSTYYNNGVLQICFRSKGCSNSLNGNCLMCDYGVGSNINEQELSYSFDKAICSCKDSIRTLLLNSYGSILDESEISMDCFKVLLNKIKMSNINNVIFETHVNTISKEKIELIRNIIGDKRISFEIGLESINPVVRENNLLKFIDNDRVVDVIKLIHSYNMYVNVNLLVGIPFLNTNDQLNDVLNSIYWCNLKGVDEIDLFPLNIKPYTLLYNLYNEGKVDRISHWLLIEILNRIPKDILSKIYLAWYGNRELKYEEGISSILPDSCGVCNEILMEFYSNFISNSDSNYRRELIGNLIDNTKCDCYQKVLKKLK